MSLSEPINPKRVESIPDQIANLTTALDGTNPPTNPIPVMKCAEWWYKNGRGGADPVFRWAIAWLHQVANGKLPDQDIYSDFHEYIDHFDLADW